MKKAYMLVALVLLLVMMSSTAFALVPQRTATIQAYPTVRVIKSVGFTSLTAYRSTYGYAVVSWYKAPYNVRIKGGIILAKTRAGEKTTIKVGTINQQFVLTGY